MTAQEITDNVVADTEGTWLDESAQTDDQTTDGRPPHPVDWQTFERILKGVEKLGEEARLQPCQNAKTGSGN